MLVLRKKAPVMITLVVLTRALVARVLYTPVYTPVYAGSACSTCGDYACTSGTGSVYDACRYTLALLIFRRYPSRVHPRCLL